MTKTAPGPIFGPLNPLRSFPRWAYRGNPIAESSYSHCWSPAPRLTALCSGRHSSHWVNQLQFGGDIWRDCSFSVIVLASVASVVAVRPAPAQSVPVNAIGVNFSPLTTSMSYNYDWSTGTLTLGTATGSVYSTKNILESSVSDPTPPAPNGYGTFIGTARPVRSPRRGRSGPV